MTWQSSSSHSFRHRLSTDYIHNCILGPSRHNLRLTDTLTVRLWSWLYKSYTHWKWENYSNKDYIFLWNQIRMLKKPYLPIKPKLVRPSHRFNDNMNKSRIYVHKFKGRNPKWCWVKPLRSCIDRCEYSKHLHTLFYLSAQHFRDLR